MAGVYVRLGCAAVVAGALAGCGSVPDFDDWAQQQQPSPQTSVGSVSVPPRPLQCVPYAREHSRVRIYGDAYTWWDKAAGRYERGTNPKEGAVLVLAGYAGPNRAHVAVVRTLVSAREIRVDHANWLDDGAIYQNDPVADVSDANDWSKVRVWNVRAAAWGTRTYAVQGFIGPDPEGGSERVAEINDLIAKSAGQ